MLRNIYNIQHNSLFNSFSSDLGKVVHGISVRRVEGGEGLDHSYMPMGGRNVNLGLTMRVMLRVFNTGVSH